jgi:hypothetical protein
MVYGRGKSILRPESDTLNEDMVQRIFSRENLLVLGLVMLIILLLIVTSDSGPTFIYQAF